MIVVPLSVSQVGTSFYPKYTIIYQLKGGFSGKRGRQFPWKYRVLNYYLNFISFLIYFYIFIYRSFDNDKTLVSCAHAWGGFWWGWMTGFEGRVEGTMVRFYNNLNRDKKKRKGLIRSLVGKHSLVWLEGGGEVRIFYKNQSLRSLYLTYTLWFSYALPSHRQKLFLLLVLYKLF